MQRGGCVYIVANQSHNVLYVGVTSNLSSRMFQHKAKQNINSFTAKYNVHKLVYYCFYPTIEEAIAEEKRLKGGSRKAKVALIESMNDEWTDLWESDVSKW